MAQQTLEPANLWKLVPEMQIFWHLLFPAMCAGRAQRPKTQWCHGRMLYFQTAVNRWTADNNGGLCMVFPRWLHCALLLTSVLSRSALGVQWKRRIIYIQAGSISSYSIPLHRQLLAWHVYSSIDSVLWRHMNKKAIRFVVTSSFFLSIFKRLPSK